MRRLDRAEANRLQNARRIRNGKSPTPEQAIFAELARDRSKSRKSLVGLRLDRGFVWHGGPVGGRAEYRRDPFTYPGLVSTGASILKLFVTKTRRAPALLTGDHKAEATGTDSKVLALDYSYVETSKVMRGVERVELDTVWPSWAALETAILACGVPLPNVCVAYQDRQGRVWRPHLIWLLDESVCFTGKGHRRHQAAWKNALRGLTARLLPIGADPGGITNPHRHKNPLSPLWDRMVMAPKPYALDVDRRPDGACHAALRPHLPSPQEAIDILKHAVEARRGAGATKPGADHPDPAVAAESNALFRHLAMFARGRVAGHRDEGKGGRQEFDVEIAAEALAVSPPGPKAEMAALARARSVSEWTWIHFRVKRPPVPALTPEARRERFAEGAKAAAEVKSTGTMADVVAAIRRLSSDGTKPTQVAVARAVGKDVRTVRRHWTGAIAAIEGEDISLGLDKKDAGEAILPSRGLAPPPSSLSRPQSVVPRPGTLAASVLAPGGIPGSFPAALRPESRPSVASFHPQPCPSVGRAEMAVGERRRQPWWSGSSTGEFPGRKWADARFGLAGNRQSLSQAALQWSLEPSPLTDRNSECPSIGDIGRLGHLFPDAALASPIHGKPALPFASHPAANST